MRSFLHARAKPISHHFATSKNQRNEIVDLDC